MSGNSDFAEYLKTKDIQRFMNELRKKWISYGECRGRVYLKDLSQSEKEALSGILARKISEKDVRIDLKEFVEAAEKTRYEAADLHEILEAYFNRKIISRKEEKKLRENQEENFRKVLMNHMDRIHADLRLYGWLNHAQENKAAGFRGISGKDAEKVFPVIEAVNKLLTDPAEGTHLAVFAADMTGNPHAFDRNTEYGNLLTGILCYLEGNKTVDSAEQWKKLLNRYGLKTDEISGNVVLFHVPLFLDEGIHEGAEKCYDYGEPFVVASANLEKVTSAGIKESDVYVVENEMVFSYLQNQIRNIKIPLICTSGQISTTGHQLIKFLVGNHCRIFYGGDLDPEGIRICDNLWQKYPENIVPWHMSVIDYEKSISNEEVDERRMSWLDSIRNPELKKSAERLRIMKKAGYQENILSEFLDDLKK